MMLRRNPIDALWMGCGRSQQCEQVRRLAGPSHVRQAPDHPRRTDESSDVVRIRRIARVRQITPRHRVIFLIVYEHRILWALMRNDVNRSENHQVVRP